MSTTSFKETSALIEESRAIVENATDSPVLNMILQIVTNIQSRLTQIDANIDSRFDKLSNSLLLVSGRVTQVETTIDELNKKFKQCENSCNGISNLFDKIEAQTAKNTTNIIHNDKNIRSMGKYVEILPREIAMLNEKISNLEKSRGSFGAANMDIITEMQDTIEDLKCRSMKYNLIFTNLVEERYEDVELKLRTFLYNELGIQHSRDIQFGNVHRFGRRNRGGVRPIVARFLYYKDLELVLSEARWLKGTMWRIHEQFPRAVEDRRRELYSVASQARLDGKRVSMKRDKLFINNNLYTPDDTIPKKVVQENPKPKNSEPLPEHEKDAERTNTGDSGSASLPNTTPNIVIETRPGTEYRDKLLETPKDDDRRYKRKTLGSNGSNDSPPTRYLGHHPPIPGNGDTAVLY